MEFNILLIIISWTQHYKWSRHWMEKYGYADWLPTSWTANRPWPWNYYHLISTLRKLSNLLRAQEFQGSGVATPLEWLLEKLKAVFQQLVILGAIFLKI